MTKELYLQTFYGILIPFLGTSLGAGCVFFMKKSMSERISRSLGGFAAGVMVAASVWSLLIPSIEQARDLVVCARGCRILDRYSVFAAA